MNMQIKQLTLVAAMVFAASAASADAAIIDVTNNSGALGFGGGFGIPLSGGARSTHTISNFSLNGGNAVVLFFAAEGSSGTGANVQLSAKYGTQDMTVVQTAGSSRHQGSIAYIINPDVSTADIVASWVLSVESVIQAIALENVGGLVASASRDTGNQQALNYTTTLDGGFVAAAGLNNSYNGGPPAAPTTAGLDTDLLRDTVAGNFTATFAYSKVATAGSYSASIGGSKKIESGALVAFDAAIPEPASLALVGLGGLVLLTRKRS